MPKLFLLRHAQAGSSLSKNDKDRPLSPHGIQQAKLVAPYLQDIDLALCSNAKRTKMTLETTIDAGASIKKIEYLETLYNAPLGDILSALQSCEGQNIIIVAHNPGIHQLAGTLAGNGEKSQLEQIRLFYQPATLAIFDCDIENWAEIQPQANTLIDLIIPD